MRKRTVFLVISLALNVALIAGIFLRKGAAPPRPPAVVVDQAAPAVETAPVTAPPQATNAAPAFPPFRWKDVASDDLKVYRDRLRALGCPELTVHEIIKAEINEQFAARRREILSVLQGKFWGILARGELFSRRGMLQTEWGQQLQRLAEERAKVIDEVLGNGAPTHFADQLSLRREIEQRYSWLAAEKRDKIIALEEHYNQQMRDLNTSFSGDNSATGEEQEAAFKAAKEEFEKARKELLTPEELEDLKIRETEAASWAANLSGFEPTQEEWRSVAVLKADYDNALQEISTDVTLSPEEQTARQKELETKLQQQIKEALGPERFTKYELASDGQFEAARSVIERFNLPSEVALQVYQVQRDAERSTTALDQNLSPAERQSIIEAIRKETERTLRSAFGPDAFAAYKEYAGEWLGELGGASQN